MIDWGQGEYEHTATELWPVAQEVVRDAGIHPGERVLDLGSGTGNAALLAARARADVTAADPAARLLDVSRARLAAEGLEASHVRAQAEDLPFEDGAFDVVLSIFGVIFSGDPERAADEIARVLRPGGRGLVTAWEPSGPLHDAIGGLAQAAGALRPGPPPEPGLAWGDPDAVGALFAHRGLHLRVDRGTLLVQAPSAEAFVRRFETVHPLGMALTGALAAAGAYDEPRARVLARLAEATDPDGRVRFESGYLVHRLERRAGAGQATTVGDDARQLHHPG